MNARERYAELRAAREAKKAEGARMLFEACSPDEELEAAELAAAGEEQLERAVAELRAKSERFAAEAADAERSAVELSARAEELEVSGRQLGRLETRRVEADTAAATLQASLEQAIVAARTESELRLIEEARDQRRQEARGLEAECDRLREQAAEAAHHRAGAQELIASVLELRELAASYERAADALPSYLPKVVAAVREERRRERELERDHWRPDRAPDSASAVFDGTLIDTVGGLVRGVGGFIRNGSTG